MRSNTARAKLQQGGVVFGALINEHAPGVAELMGAIGYDFVMIDCEHGGMDLNQVEHMVRAAEVFGITPLVRVPDHGEATILRFLDRGVQGIIVPHVNTREEAEAVARAARYFPEGNRGAAGGRPHDYNVSVSRAESAAWINEQMLVIPMIEEMEAIANLDAILSVRGIDVLHIAAGDLGQSMGNPAPEELRRVMTDAVAKVRAAGKFAGVGGNSAANPGAVADFIKSGATFVTIPVFGLLRVGAELFRSQVQAAV